MAGTVVYDPHAMNMDVEGIRAAFDALPDYPQKDFDFQLTVLIAEYANSKGVCWPGMGVLATRLHCFKMDVKRGVDRILEFGFFAVKKVKSKGAKWEHNVYIFAKRFLRKTVDKLASHFDAAKWKTWVEEKLSERQRRKLVSRYCEQADLDLENAGLRDGWWMAMRYVKKHVGETPEEYETILAEAVEKYRDYEGPDYREIADRPVKPVSAPVQEKPAEPAPVMEKPIVEAVPVDPEPVDPEPWLQDWSKPIEWEDGSQWPIEPLSAPVQEPVEPAETVKRETSLEALPANTSAPANIVPDNTANPQSGPVELDTTNAPKFINGEVDARWKFQQLLHQLNPTQYPVY